MQFRGRDTWQIYRLTTGFGKAKEETFLTGFLTQDSKFASGRKR